MGETTQPTDAIAERIRAALAAGDLVALEPLFAPEARWGSCVGGEEIVDWMQRATESGLETTLVDLEPRSDRVVLCLAVRQRAEPDPESRDTRVFQTAFVVDDQIIELREAGDRDDARRVTPGAPPPSPTGPRTNVTVAAAIFPVADLTTALARFRQLGFAVRGYEGGGYGFVERGSVELHLGEEMKLDPHANTSAVYLFVEDADALYAEWRAAGADGRLVEPTDTEYRVREGSYVDPDGNLIRFGSPLDR